MKIVLSAVDDDMADAWERHCGDLPDVTIHRGSILDLSIDAVVSSSNMVSSLRVAWPANRFLSR